MSVTQTIRDVAELTPVAQQACRLLFQECYKAGIRNLFITETYRPQARQNYLYEQGRTRSGQIITWTKSSRHTSRLAWDIACSSPATAYDVVTLSRVGAIARRLGITWGGDWENNVDRPHFEVKNTWKMPAGYRLEGQVIIPSNSKLRVQLVVEDKTEEAEIVDKVEVFDPGSTTLRTSAENYLAKAVEEGIIRDTHLKDFQNNLMTGDRLLGLFITVEQRRNENRSNTLTVTGKSEVEVLLKRAYLEGTFKVDHSGNVNRMSDGEINSLLAAYLNRKV